MTSRSVSDQLKDIFSPKPKDYDPELQEWAGATAHRRSKASTENLDEYDESKQSEAYMKAPTRRSMKAQPAMGEAYRGKKATRSQLGFAPEASDSESSSPSDLDEELDGQIGNGEMSVSDADSMEQDGDEIDLDDISDSDDDEMDDDGENAIFDGDDAAMEADELERELMEEDEEAQQAEQLQRLKLDAAEELQKAQHALNQRVLWDAMLDLRLKLQGPQTEANQFPQADVFEAFVDLNKEAVKRLKLREEEFDVEVHRVDASAHQNDTEVEMALPKFDDRLASVDLSQKLSAAKSQLLDTLNDLVVLQNTLLQNNEEFEEGAQEKASELGLVQKRKRLRSEISATPSPTDQAPWFHQIDTETLWDHLDAFHRPLIAHSEQVADRWARKVLYSAEVTSSKFKAINQSISAQVDQIMTNTDKAIGRTQLRREEYHILGKEDGAGAKISAADAASGAAAALIADQKDPEIFDDGDFCQVLLKEIMEAGLTDTSDPIELTRRFLALRDKRRAFKKVDRKPSKGKTLKYSEQSKLVAFMAPVPGRYPMHDAYVTSQLILSLFGNKPDISTNGNLDVDSEEEIFA